MLLHNFYAWTINEPHCPKMNIGLYDLVFRCKDFTYTCTTFLFDHYCSCYWLNWTKLAEASHLVVRLETPALVPSVRMKLQLPFYQLPFSSQSQTVTALGAFMLFTTLGHSSLPQMQRLSWVVQSLRLPLGLDWTLTTWQYLWGSCCGWMNWR